MFAPDAAVTSTTTTSSSTCSDPNTTFEKKKKGKKKLIRMCQWAAGAAAKEEKHRKRCNGKKKKIVTVTATSTTIARVLVKVKDECPCACAKFNGNDDTVIDNDDKDDLPSSSLCPATEGLHGDMAYILSNQPCNNDNNPMMVCNYSYIKTGCTIETQACQPIETCWCNVDNSKWLCTITDYQFINHESCLGDDAPRPTLRPTDNRDRALAASVPNDSIPKDIGLECNPNAAAELESTIDADTEEAKEEDTACPSTVLEAMESKKCTDKEQQCDYDYIYTGCTYDTLACGPMATCSCGSPYFPGSSNAWFCSMMAVELCTTTPRDTTHPPGVDERLLLLSHTACDPTQPLPKDDS